MTNIVYNIARPRKIPFFTLDPFFGSALNLLIYTKSLSRIRIDE